MCDTPISALAACPQALAGLHQRLTQMLQLGGVIALGMSGSAGCFYHKRAERPLALATGM